MNGSIKKPAIAASIVLIVLLFLFGVSFNNQPSSSNNINNSPRTLISAASEQIAATTTTTTPSFTTFPAATSSLLSQPTTTATSKREAITTALPEKEQHLRTEEGKKADYDEERQPADQVVITSQHNSNLLLTSANIYSPRCHLSTENELDGGCKPNPWFVPGRADSVLMMNKKMMTTTKSATDEHMFERESPRVVNEHQCAWRVPSSRATVLNLRELVKEVHNIGVDRRRRQGNEEDNDNDNNNNPQSLLLDFKRHTSWMFDKWYDFGQNAKCASNVSNDGKIHGALLSRDLFRTSSSSASSVVSSRASRQNDDPTHLGGNYRLSNFCIRPIGKLAGYGARKKNYKDPGPVELWRGTHESFKVNGVPGRAEGGTAQFLSWKNIENLKSRPDCFLDNIKVVLFPITSHGDNAGHMFHRAASLLRFIEAVFGIKSREQLREVTVIYFVTDPGHPFAATPDLNRHRNLQRFYYDVVGTSWASVFVQDLEDVFGWSYADLLRLNPEQEQQEQEPVVDDALQKMLSEQHRGGIFAAEKENFRKRHRFNFSMFPAAKRRLQAPLCFKEAFVWHNADERFAAFKDFAAADEVGKRTSFVLFGPRSMRDVETLNVVNKRLRMCTIVTDKNKTASTSRPRPQQQKQRQQLQMRRAQARTKNPHVLFVVRSSSRRFLLQPYLINVIAGYVRQELEGTFEVLEHTDLDFDEVIERFSKADILIGMLGAGLLWLELLPPGAVVIEFNAPNYRCASVSGVNTNVDCDFGGSAAAAQQWHIAIHVSWHPLVRRRVDVNKTMLHHPGAGGAQSHTNLVYIGPGGSDLAIGAPTMLFALEKAKCLLERGGRVNLDKVVQSVPARCSFTREHLIPVFKLDVDDDDGESLGACVQMNLLPAYSSSRGNDDDDDDDDDSLARLRLMISHKKQIANALTKQNNLRYRQQINVMIITRCSSSYSGSILSEVRAWRMILPDTYRITVGEFADGASKCARKAQAKKEAAQKNKNSSNNNETRSTSSATALFDPQHYYANKASYDYKFHGITFCRMPCVVPGGYHVIVRSSVRDDDGGDNKRESQGPRLQQRHNNNKNINNFVRSGVGSKEREEKSKIIKRYLVQSEGVAVLFSFDEVNGRVAITKS